MTDISNENIRRNYKRRGNETIGKGSERVNFEKNSRTGNLSHGILGIQILFD